MRRVPGGGGSTGLPPWKNEQAVNEGLHSEWEQGSSTRSVREGNWGETKKALIYRREMWEEYGFRWMVPACGTYVERALKTAVGTGG